MISFFIYGQNNCEGFLAFQERTLLEYTHFDKKNDKSSRTTHHLTLIDELDDGFEAQVEAQTFDKVDELIHEGAYRITCKEGNFHLDVISMMAPELKNAFSNFEITISGDPLLIPNNLEVGQTLPDASSEVQASTDGLKLPKFIYTLSDRKVESQEELEVPAGTFNCYKITYSLSFKAVIARNLTISEWYAKGVGLIKSETYNKKKRLVAQSILTKLNR